MHFNVCLAHHRLHDFTHFFKLQQIKADVRRMWYLEYEIADLQEEFAKEMGSFDTENMTVDFIEDMLIKSKPLQIVLLGIRRKQKVSVLEKIYVQHANFMISEQNRHIFISFLYSQDTLDELKKKYGDSIKDLEPLYIPRPPKPDHDTLLKMKEGMSLKQASQPAEEAPKPEEAPASEAAPAAPEATDLPAEPGPAIEGAAQQPAEVAA